MPAKADAYRQMADHATENLTAQVMDWTKFLLMAGKFYKYGFLDQVDIFSKAERIRPSFRSNTAQISAFPIWS